LPRAASTCIRPDAHSLRQRDASGARRCTAGHAVEEARSRGWDSLGNGELLTAAETAGFEVFVTTDRNLRYQQNLTERNIAIVILGNGRWRLIRTKLAEIAAAVNAGEAR
jgi:hypothetical protein